MSLDESLGDDRSGPRFSYLDSNLEITTTSNEHERIKEWIGGLLAIYFEESGIEVIPRGQATMRDTLGKAGADPDKSWCIREDKEFPDLVLEITLTSGGLDKLEIYRHFLVPEVWFWRGLKLEIFTLVGGGNYETAPRSRLLPTLDTVLIERCMAIGSWQSARQTFRAGLAKSS